jgi:hypothetical protein
MSNRRAQDERIEGTPDGSNAITEIVDVPDRPTIGTATGGLFNASVPFTAATTGGTPSLYTATSSPGSLTGTSATSPITVSGLTGGTAYTFTVTPSNSTGTGPASSSSNSVTIPDLVSAYDSLATVTVGTAVSSITFAGIPTGYDHLQLRMITRNTASGVAGTLDNWLTFNSDSGSNYSFHLLQGNGTAATASAGATQTRVRMINQSPGASSTANTFGAAVIDILDYASTNKNKTVRILYGANDNTTNTEYRMFLYSGLWYATATAITSITLVPETANFAEYSSFALYGVK